MIDADVDTGEARMAIGTIAHDHIDFSREQESAPRLQRFGVLQEARWQPGFPGGGLSRAIDRVLLFALTTVWESTGVLATDDHGQVATKRALMRRAAVRWTWIEPNRSGSACYC